MIRTLLKLNRIQSRNNQHDNTSQERHYCGGIGLGVWLFFSPHYPIKLLFWFCRQVPLLNQSQNRKPDRGRQGFKEFMDSDKEGTASAASPEYSSNFINRISNFIDGHILEIRVTTIAYEIMHVKVWFRNKT